MVSTKHIIFSILAHLISVGRRFDLRKDNDLNYIITRFKNLMSNKYVILCWSQKRN